MKGILYTELLKHIENNHGQVMVDKVLDAAESSTHLQTSGAYTSVGNYPHSEFLALLNAYASLTNRTVQIVLDSFAIDVMAVFHASHPEFFTECKDFFEFARSINDHIHVEVRKLYDDANPPELIHRELDDNSLRIDYSSHRPFAALVPALLGAATRYFDGSYTVETIDTDDAGLTGSFAISIAEG